MKKSYLKYIVALLLFGTNGIIASNIQITSLYIVLYRTFLGSVLLLIIYLMSKNQFAFFKDKKNFLYIGISGIAMSASWLFLFEAYNQIGVSISTLLYYCGPIIVVILSPFIFKEKLTLWKILGFGMVIVGIFFVNNQSIGKPNVVGFSYGLLSAIMYAIMVISNKKSTTMGLENSVIQLITSFLTVLVFSIVKNGFVLPSIQTSNIIWISILGLVNTGIGCYLYFSSIGNLPVQSVAILGYLEPLSAVIFSILILKEFLSTLQILGSILIMSGVILGGHIRKTN